MSCLRVQLFMPWTRRTGMREKLLTYTPKRPRRYDVCHSIRKRYTALLEVDTFGDYEVKALNGCRRPRLPHVPPGEWCESARPLP